MLEIVFGQMLYGIMFGLFIGLVALGLNVTFGILRIVNFAHGELYMLGALSGLLLGVVLQSFWVTLLIAPIIVGGVGLALGLVFIKHIYGGGFENLLRGLLLTFGLSLFLRESGDLILWGGYKAIPTPLGGSMMIFGVTYPFYRLFITGVAVALVAFLWFFFNKTSWGSIIRAVSSDREMLSCLGVDVSSVLMWTFAFGAALAAVAGLLMAPIVTVYAEMGMDVLIWSFFVVVAGGMGSIIGSVITAILLGSAYSMVVLLQDPRISEVVVFVAALVILVVRPRGLFGERALMEARS